MDINDEVLRTIRRIIRSIDLHSRKLSQNHGLTSSQAVVLQEIQRTGPLPISTLAKHISLSHATVTDILKRLEKKEIVTRVQDEKDRRRVMVQLTPAGTALLANLPSLLQQRFIRRFERLQEWEKTMILANLQRVATLMEAEDLGAAPLLATGALVAVPEATGG